MTVSQLHTFNDSLGAPVAISDMNFEHQYFDTTQAALALSRSMSDGADSVFQSAASCLETLMVLGARIASDVQKGPQDVAMAIRWSLSVLDSGLVGAVVTHSIGKFHQSCGGNAAPAFLADEQMRVLKHTSIACCLISRLLSCLVISMRALWGTALALCQDPIRQQLEDLVGAFQESAEHLTVDIARLSADTVLHDPIVNDTSEAAPSAAAMTLISSSKLKSVAKTLGVDMQDEATVKELLRGYNDAHAAAEVDECPQQPEAAPCKPALAGPKAVTASEIMDHLQALGKSLRLAVCLVVPPAAEPKSLLCGVERLKDLGTELRKGQASGGSESRPWLGVQGAAGKVLYRSLLEELD